jgi:Zn-dependent M16 (insulinase) family peptidase
MNSNSLENSMNFSTYRDPVPLRSLDVISNLMKNGGNVNILTGNEDYLVKSIIGCYAKETYPLTNAEKGGVDFLRFLYGIKNDYLEKRLERLINISSADIKSVFASFGSRASGTPVIISGMKGAEQAAKTLGTNVTLLPL